MFILSTKCCKWLCTYMHTYENTLFKKGNHTLHSMCFINAIFFPLCLSSTSVNTSSFLAFLNAHKVTYMVGRNMNADYTKACDGWLFLNWWTSPILLHTQLSSWSCTNSSTSTGRAPTHSLRGYLTDHDITFSVHSLSYRWTFCSFWFPFFATYNHVTLHFLVHKALLLFSTMG